MVVDQNELPLASASGLKGRLQIGFSHIINVTRNSHHLSKKGEFNQKCYFQHQLQLV